MFELNNEDKLILYCSKLNINTADIQQIKLLIDKITNWEYFAKNAFGNSVAPLIYKNLISIDCINKIPSTFETLFKNTYYKSLSSNIVFYQHFANIITALNSSNINVIALKGIFLSDFIYGDIGKRQMSDIDLLIKPEYAKICQDILTKIGYKSIERVKSEHIKKFHALKHLPPLILGSVPVEIHLTLFDSNSEINIEIEDYWKRAIPVTVNNFNVLSLSPNDILQHLCIHLDDHFNTGKIQFYSYCDIIAVLEFYKTEINWTAFEYSCKKYNCTKSVFKQLFLVNKYFNVDLPMNIIEKSISVCNIKLEEFFIAYLKRDKKWLVENTINFNIENLKLAKGFKNKILYLIDDILPKKSFMYKRYNIKNRSLVYWYYFLRVGVGVKKFIEYIFNKAQ